MLYFYHKLEKFLVHLPSILPINEEKICQETIAIITIIIDTVNGLLQRKLQEPSLINNDLLKFSSINPPKTKAKIKGGIGKS